MLKERHAVESLDCGFVSRGNNSPQRRLRFTVGDEQYVLNVRLEDTAPRLIGR